MEIHDAAPIAIHAMEPKSPSRIALLSLGDSDQSAASNRRMVQGVSALERQIDMALALGCTRIWLFAHFQDDLAIRAQRLAEKGGAQFRIIQKGRQLLGGLRQQDMLLVLAEGLLVQNRAALDVLGSEPAILRMPADEGLPEGFERLDQEYCWAGAMILPGRVLECLDELGDDIDPVSALLRAGRAGRVPEVPLQDGLLASGKWSLSGTSLIAAESRKDQHDYRSFLTRTVFEPVGLMLVGRKNLLLACAVAGGSLVPAAIATLYVGHPVAALVLVVFASAFLSIWISALRQGDARVLSGDDAPNRMQALVLLPDAIGTAALGAGLYQHLSVDVALYMLVVTVGLWVIAGFGKAKSAKFFRDRLPLWIICAVAGIFAQWFAIAALATAGALLGILLNMRKQAAITQA